MFLRRLALIFLLGSFPLFAAKTPTVPPDAGSYKGAIVVDAASGKVLFEDHADEVSPPASMTKLMTFAVLDDELRAGKITLTTPVKVTVADSRMAASKVWLDPKETFPVEELMYAMMIHSANDAARALTHAGGDSVEAFVAAMNAKARELGMVRTVFRTPHGLPPASRKLTDGDLSTPRDFALLCRYLLLKTDVLKYSSIKKRPFRANDPAHTVELTSSDHLLGEVEGVDGLKTGFTNGAGWCLSATAERDGRRVIVVLMDAPTQARRNQKVTDLLNRGFATLPADAKFTGPASPMQSSPIEAAAPFPANASPIQAAPPAPGPRAAGPISPAAPASAPVSQSSESFIPVIRPFGQ
jgi:D-alanyl-D-alanine carboxypeptidase